ncbi:MAG: DNA polymerase I, partial [Clostridia bacterium]|nr:DNA polymerase I [Clostridia bacterium]
RYTDIETALEKCSVFAVALFEDSACVYVDNVHYSLRLSTDLLSGDGLDYDCYCKILNKIYSDPKNKVIAYDFKSQLHKLKEAGITVACGFEDLAVIKYLCDYSSTEDGVNFLCQNNGYKTEFAAFAVFELYNKYFEKLKAENVLQLYEEIEKPLLLVLFQMEETGVKVSVECMDELSKQYSELIEEYKNKIFEACGKTFNINSPAQLGETLFNMGVTEVKKKKADKYSTAAEILEKLVDKYPVVGDVLKFRLYQKLNSTYIQGFRPLIEKSTGLIHTTYHQTLTSTGRLSSSNPNLQNIPIRADEGRELRKIFVAREGNVFIDADYSQIELRLLAHFSGCKELIEAYTSGSDIHAATAAQVFEVPVEEVTPAMRRAAKAVNFGIIYGISEYGLSKNLNISSAKAREYIEKYFQTYSAVKDYMNANVEFAKANGFVATLTGRKRVIPEINSSNYNLRQFGERAAMNMPLQGSSADIIKIAMIKVAEKLKAEGMKTEIILQVHDELVLEAPENEAERAAEILKECMENAVELKVPLTVEVHAGKTWYDAK